MDKNTPPLLTLDEVLNIVRELGEDAARHEQSLEKVMAFLRQQSVQWQHQHSQAEPSASSCTWMPSRWTEAEPTKPLKISKIDALPTNEHDVVASFRNSWFGRIYRSHLKRYSSVRVLVQWAWRKGYPLYINHLAKRIPNRLKKRWRTLVALSEFTKKMGIPKYRLANAVRIETPEPIVFPTCDQGYLVSPNDPYEFPEVFVSTITSAMISGGTNLILADGQVVCHDLYDFERDYTSEELHGRLLIDPKSMRIRWLVHDEAPVSVPIAATFLDGCALNYAHWITEVLTRIVLFCSEDKFRSIPIVVNDGLHKNIMESLFLVAGPDREIITLPIGRALAVDELLLTSVAGYVPFERRTTMGSGHSHGMFSPKALTILRNHLNALEQPLEEIWPEKIFLRRNSGTRKVTNSIDLEKLLVSQGFVIAEPEKLTFLQQVKLFANAKVIVGATGAAFANAVFCKPGTQVGILISKHKGMSYGFWVNVLSPIGINVSYVLGNIVENYDYGVHGNFEVSLCAMQDFLAHLGRK